MRELDFATDVSSEEVGGMWAMMMSFCYEQSLTIAGGHGVYVSVHINWGAVDRVKRKKFLGMHITEDIKMVPTHRHRGEEGATVPLQTEAAEEICHGP